MLVPWEQRPPSLLFASPLPNAGSSTEEMTYECLLNDPINENLVAARFCFFSQWTNTCIALCAGRLAFLIIALNNRTAISLCSQLHTPDRARLILSPKAHHSTAGCCALIFLPAGPQPLPIVIVVIMHGLLYLPKDSFLYLWFQPLIWSSFIMVQWNGQNPFPLTFNYLWNVQVRRRSHLT
jgi:hypothetical protein